jgi:hypothetical protein
MCQCNNGTEYQLKGCMSLKIARCLTLGIYTYSALPHLSYREGLTAY